MTQQMLINHIPGEECRIAIVEGDRLEELYHERGDHESHVGNIYKGRVVNVEAGIQAAFIDFGLERNGFLHISDLHPKYFPGSQKEETERVGKKTPRRERPPMQHCLKRGQEVLVQVIKEGIGTKGPTLTSYLSIPGRYLVLMPDMERHGVSRKTEDDDLRRETRKTLDQLDLPDGFGFIVRSAGLGRPKTELKRDLAYLQRLWKAIDKRMRSRMRVGELYTESDLIIRTIRDVFTPDIERIIVDDIDAAKRAHEFLAIANPRASSKVLVYDDPVPLFHRYGLEAQIDSIQQREVEMPSGGSLVIDSTEALVAIDVNSGKMRNEKDAETTALRTNLEAADEVCRQLRLRDLGGVVVIDMIDMLQSKNRRQVESRVRENLKKDRARTRVNPISQFGLLEMTRQRMRPSLKKSTYNLCTACAGTGHTKRPESVVLDVIRSIALVMSHPNVHRIEVVVSPDIAFQLLNRKRMELVHLEQSRGKPVLVRVGGSRADYFEVFAFDDRDGAVKPDRRRKHVDAIVRTIDEMKAILGERQTQTAPIEEDEDGLDIAIDDDTDTADADMDGEPSDRSEGDESDEAEETGGKKKRRRRRRRRRGKKTDDGDDQAQQGEAGDSQSEAPSDGDSRPGDAGTPEATGEPTEGDAASADSDGETDEDGAPKKKRRRRRRGGRRRRRGGRSDAESEATGDSEVGQASESGEPVDAGDSGEARDDDAGAAEPGDSADADEPSEDAAVKKKRRSRGGRRRKKAVAADATPTDSSTASHADSQAGEQVSGTTAAASPPASEPTAPAGSSASPEDRAEPDSAADDKPAAKKKAATRKRSTKKSSKKKSTKKKASKKKAASRPSSAKGDDATATEAGASNPSGAASAASAEGGEG